MNKPITVTRDDETGDILVGETQRVEVDPVLRGHAENLATTMDASDLDEIGTFSITKADEDKQSRSEWEAQNERAMKLKGIGPESEPDNIDYEDANTSDHPLLLSASLRFLATAASEMLPPEKVCTGKSAFDTTVLPPDARLEADMAIEAAIKRVERYYADYLLERLPSYAEDTDLILRDCADSGVGWRKIYVDPSITNPIRVDYVPTEDLFINYGAKNPRDSRITHRMFVDAHDLIRMMRAGIYRVVDLGSGDAPEEDPVTQMRDVIQGLSDRYISGTEGHTLYETHCRLFLPQDPHPKGLSRPYVVTTHKTTQQVVAIRRNWVEGDPDETPIQHFVPYVYHPGKSALFGMGQGTLLANQTEALRDGQRAALDAGYLANHPAGFKKSTMSIREDNTRVKPGEFVDVDSPGSGPISDMLMIHPFEGPNPGLLALIDKMEQNGKELGGIATADLTSMMGPSVAPGPALAAYDEQTKFQSAVHARIYRAHRAELTLVHQRTREIFGNKPVPYGVNSTLEPEDLILVDLLPAMDPAQISRGRRMIEAQVNLDTAERFPDVMDRRAAVLDFLNATGSVADNQHLLLPEEADAKPLDPVTEYMNVLKGRPVVAGPAQNHQAHIDAHVANMQGIQNSSLSTEDGARVMGELASHIADHMALDLAVQVAMLMGMPLENFMEGIPPEIEIQIAPMVAQAIQAIEQARAEPNPEETKVIIEQIRAENRIAVEEIKGQMALERERLQGIQNDADNATSTLNNREDNATALLIAGIQGKAKAGQTPRGDTPSTNPAPPSAANNATPNPRARPT